jgi:hypothetical protein
MQLSRETLALTVRNRYSLGLTKSSMEAVD